MRRRGIALFGLVVSFFISGCSTSENFNFKKEIAKSSPTASYVWNPEYYVYRNGKYRFVPGAYLPVISRKSRFKRSLKGYTYKSDYATNR